MGLYSNLVSKVSGLTRREPKQTRNARDLVIFSDGSIVDHFARLGYAVGCDQLVFTLETVEDYAEAREHVWHRPGRVAAHDAGGLLVKMRSHGRHNRRVTSWWSVLAMHAW
jgi:hypothetical protein